MAGELGVAQFEMLLRCGHLRPGEIGLQLTNAGSVWLVALGITAPAKTSTRLACAQMLMHGCSRSLPWGSVNCCCC